jgi:hypothetical protein
MGLLQEGRKLGKNAQLSGAGDCLGAVGNLKLAIDAGRVNLMRISTL